ncbi:MAG: hypothetical protein M1840_007237 [Geoglossum simile]|nr:MAG: hypothetical protein M1840_007237 [Geoglossum simile]
MGRQYTAEELLRLRDSPLVRKPDGLPPPEEWMGSQEQTLQNHQSQRIKRGSSNNKGDESSFSNELPTRRPSLFDQGRHISRTSIPEDIVLGPPKTSFASATYVRNFNKPFDSPDRPSFSNHDEDGSRTDLYNLRERFSKDRERPDRDGVGGRAGDFRPGGTNARRGAREDGDDWTSVKPRRSFGQEDDERISRRNGDRDRDNGKDNKERQTRPFENSIRDKERDHEKEDSARRNLTGRGRNEPTWFNNNENSTNSKEVEGNKDSIREREWRDKRGGDSRDWARGSRTENRPEWMDSSGGDESKTHEKKQSHTMEEFQRWKERMKAGNGNAPPPEEKKKVTTEEEAVSERTPEATTQKNEPSGQKFDTPLVLETSEDKFFGLWNEPKRSSEDLGPDISRISSKKEVSRPTVGKSRFTSFFSPQEELQRRGKVDAPLPHTSPPPGLSKDSSTEDKEGFQRILQMLGGTTIDTVPSAQQMGIITQKPIIQDRSHSQASTGVSSPVQGPTPGQGLGYHTLNQDQPYPPRSRNSAGIQGLLGPQSPQAGGQPQNRDSEFLFRLMQQSRPISGPPQLPSLSGQSLLGNTQGLPPPPQISTGLVDMPRGKLHQGLNQGGGMFDDPSITGFQRPGMHQAPRESNGPPSRPPGLENVPQVWPNNPLGAPQSHHRQIAPPPGLNAQRGPPFAPFLPPPPGLPFQIPGMPPPNLPPPPGFFAMNGMNGPPSGYPPLPFQPNDFMGMSGPGGHGGGGPGAPQFPFAEGVNGANGRGAPPGQYTDVEPKRRR